MRRRREAIRDTLQRRPARRAQLLAEIVDALIPWTAAPGYGLSGPDRETVRQALRHEHDRLWALSFDELLDEPREQRVSLALPNRLPAVLVVEIFPWRDDETGTHLSATVDVHALHDGPAWTWFDGVGFWIDRDGRRGARD